MVRLFEFLRYLLLTGRPFIRDEIGKCSSAWTLPISPSSEDAKILWKVKLDEDQGPGAMNPGLRADYNENYFRKQYPRRTVYSNA